MIKMDLEKALKKQKEIELSEIKKDRQKGIPVRINPDSRVAKEIEYQTYLLKEIQDEIRSIKKSNIGSDQTNEIDTQNYLEHAKDNDTLFNAEIYLDEVLRISIFRMANILYLDCKNEYGTFDQELFKKMSANLKEKISTHLENVIDIYKKL